MPGRPDKSLITSPIRLVRGASAALALCVFLLSPPVQAIGIGMPTLNPIVGQPLRIEIPLQLAAGEILPPTGCASIALPHDAPDKQLFPAHARVVVDTAGAPKIVIVSPQPVAEPLLEFRLTVGCNKDISRDYLILSDPPLTPGQAKPPPPAPTAGTSPQPAPALSPPAKAPNVPSVPNTSNTPSTPLAPSLAQVRTSAASPSLAGEALTVQGNTNLNALARARYPDNQATRDEYRRLMALANPELFAGKQKIGSIPLPAGTVLVIPDNLPPPEEKAAVRPADRSVPGTPPSRPRQAPDGESAIKAASAPRKDRLIVGGESLLGSNTMNARQMSDTVARLERMIEDQGRTAVNIAESLHNLNLAVVETRNYIQKLEASQKKSLAEQRALQSRLEQAEQKLEKAQGVWELLVLIIASGGMGAALLMLHHRLQSRRNSAQMPIGGSAEPAQENKTLESSAKSKEVPPPASKPATPRSPSPPPSPRPIPAAPLTPSASPLAASAPKTPVAPMTPSVPSASKSSPPPQRSRSTPLPLLEPEFSPPPARIAVPQAPTLAIATAEPARPEPTIDYEAAAPAAAPAHAPIGFELIPRPEGEFDPQAELLAAEPAPLKFTAESVRHENSYLELASIMESMGLVKEAADIIVEHLMMAANDDLDPWLTALNLYRKTGRQEEFMVLADKLNQKMNVFANSWDYDPSSSQPRSLLDFQRIVSRIQELWHLNDKSECEAYLNELLVDNRGSMRNGFPQDVAEEISLLLKMIRSAD